MSIKYLRGDATVPTGSGKKIIVHSVNNIGVWGAGFVLALSRKWPEPEASYKSGLLQCLTKLGTVQFVPVTDYDGHDIVVANLVGQNGIRSSTNPTPVRYNAIEQGLERVAKEAQKLKATVHMPRLGCGLGGGNWSHIEPLIKKTCKDVDVYVYDL